MAQVISIGEPVNDTERIVIGLLRDQLPSTYILIHNFEIQRGETHFEVDLAILAPHAVYLVDIKGTRGLIDVYGPKWYPDGRQPFTSPLLKLRSHARAFKGIITDSQPGRQDLQSIYVDAVVVLAAPDAVLQDPTGLDASSVVTLKKAVAFFQNSQRIPGHFSKAIVPQHNMVIKAIQGVGKPRTGPLRFGNWEVEERLGGTDAYTEYRAFNSFAGLKAGRVLLRAYKADPMLPEEARRKQRTRIATAYKALSQLPPHPSILGARDFFASEGEDFYYLVTDDIPGQALRVYIDKPGLALTLDQKLKVATGLLNALRHAHKHGVVHRNLTPSTVIFTPTTAVLLVGFDFARVGSDRSQTIAEEIVEDLDPLYLAPEVQGEPAAASAASDVFSAGLVLYELLTGQRPFSSPTEVFDLSGQFPVSPSTHRGEVPTWVDTWLQKLCAFTPEERPSAAAALAELTKFRASAQQPKSVEPSAPQEKPPVPPPAEAVDYRQLPPGFQLTRKHVVEKALGAPGAFGVAYKVIDTFGDVPRAIKLVLRDSHSPLERLQKEYKTLLRVPDHPRVVKVVDADLLPGEKVPYLVFEFIEGLDVGAMVDQGLFAPEDVLDLLRQVAEGLVHLHMHGVYHCDIKPRNLLWTDQGVRIIDFNVSVMATEVGHGGGSQRYLPPDYDLGQPPQPRDRVDRDLYALGVTAYEALTGRYPWLNASKPPPGQPATDPRDLPNLGDLAPELAQALLKLIEPRRADRYNSAADVLASLTSLKAARRPRPPLESTSSWSEAVVPSQAVMPNSNPFVGYLQSLYSQSHRTNAGTRGLDDTALATYVQTALDRELTPAVLNGELRLVVVTGNAGDGKTAFLQKLELEARERQAVFDPRLANGRRFRLQNRTYLTNYDGSQDEGEAVSDDVLRVFLGPFGGDNSAHWPANEVRLIAINEGRLVDFLTTERGQFKHLEQLIRSGFSTGEVLEGVAVVNLNLRSAVTSGGGQADSILDHQMRRMTHEKFWEACQSCDLKGRCYALHNAQTFQDGTAGPKVLERLKTLFTLNQLRGRLHVTLRDLRSALAFMLGSGRDCAEIHQLYQEGERDAIVSSFYFNAWMAADSATADRLLILLRDLDMGMPSDPRLDRGIDFVSPTHEGNLFRFEGRSGYDRDVLKKIFDDLPRDYSGNNNLTRIELHQRFVAMCRRRRYFEQRDASSSSLLPHRAAARFLELMNTQTLGEEVLLRLLTAINRGEGISQPERVGAHLALQVRQVEKGTIRSYRLFPASRFSVSHAHDAHRARFVEHAPEGLVLRYTGVMGSIAELRISLDVFEMLERLNAGYRPTLEQEQGHYQSLTVFKNLLNAEPYQEVLLTVSGHDFYRIKRHSNGLLEMNRLGVNQLEMNRLGMEEI